MGSRSQPFAIQATAAAKQKRKHGPPVPHTTLLPEGPLAARLYYGCCEGRQLSPAQAALNRYHLTTLADSLQGEVQFRWLGPIRACVDRIAASPA